MEDQTDPGTLKYGKDTLLEELPYETPTYKLQVGRAVGLAGPVYQLVNKKYDLIEGESFSLVEAIHTLIVRTKQVEEQTAALETDFPNLESPVTVH